VGVARPAEGLPARSSSPSLCLPGHGYLEPIPVGALLAWAAASSAAWGWPHTASSTIPKAFGLEAATQRASASWSYW